MENSAKSPGNSSSDSPKVAAGSSSSASSAPAVNPFTRNSLVALLAVVAVAGWAYFVPLTGLSHMWFSQPDYSHGFLVPLFSLYLLWVRRDLFKPTQFATDRTLSATVVGMALILAAGGIRLFSAYRFYPLADAPSLIPCLAGFVIFIGGWSALRWAWPAVLYLAFMLPLPGSLAGMLSNPLQRVATLASTWLLQLFAVPAVSKGNVIWLTTGKIGVVEACSGLRMLMLFLAITVGASFIIKRPLWEKVFVALSALVIAVITNILRITVTAFLYEYVGAELAEKVFHDLAGWLMMPVATGLLFLELYVLSKLLVVPAKSGPVMLRRTALGR